jgi:hypothetical protein
MTTEKLLERLRVLQRSLATAGFVSLIYDDVAELIADIEKNGVDWGAQREDYVGHHEDETLAGTVTVLAR